MKITARQVSSAGSFVILSHSCMTRVALEFAADRTK